MQLLKEQKRTDGFTMDKKIRKTRPINYDTRLYVKISTDDKEQLRDLATANNLTINEMVRTIIKTQLDLFGNQTRIQSERIKQKKDNN